MKTEKLLMQFISHLESVGAGTITIDEAVLWARLPVTASPAWWRRRLMVVRLFARHLQALDPATQVPPAGLLHYGRDRIPPHLYSRDEITRLTRAAAESFVQPLRVATYQCVIGILAVTGMRVGELVRLDRADVDLTAGIVTILNSKHGKSRQVLLHSTTISALHEYVWQQNVKIEQAPDQPGVTTRRWSHNWQERSHDRGRNPAQLVPSRWRATPLASRSNRSTPDRRPPDGSPTAPNLVDLARPS